MKKLTLCLAVSLALTGLSACQTQGSPEAMASKVSAAVKQDQNQAFSAFSQSFIDSLWQVAPTWALYNGFHQYDGKLLVPDANSRTATLNFIQQQRAKMASFDFAALTAANLIDYRLIENVLGSMEWEIKRFKSWQWDPSSYNVAGGFAQIINEDFAPLDQRLRSALGRLENVPAYYRAAQQNIDNPTLEHTELAIMQNQGAFTVLSDELLAKVNASGLSADEKGYSSKEWIKPWLLSKGISNF